MATKPTKGEWSTGLCGCFEDCSSCCFGFFCTPCLYGQNAAKIEERDSCCVNCCLYALLHIFCACACLAKQKRKDLRQKYNLAHGKCCGDFASHCWCSACAVCQDTREIKFQEKRAKQVGGAQFMQAPGQQVMM